MNSFLLFRLKEASRDWKLYKDRLEYFGDLQCWHRWKPEIVRNRQQRKKKQDICILYIHKRPGGYISTKYVYIKLDAMASQIYINININAKGQHSTEKHKIRPQNIKWTTVTFVLKRQKKKKLEHFSIGWKTLGLLQEWLVVLIIYDPI